jgi:tyrosyl-tRNA synthetase
MKLFTDLPIDDIEAHLAGDINAAKIVLATEATALCRGRAAAQAAAATAAATFAGGAGDDLPGFAVAAPVTIVDALVGLGFAASKGEARRLVTGGGARINGEAVASETVLVGPGARISAGKKRHGVIIAD